MNRDKENRNSRIFNRIYRIYGINPVTEALASDNRPVKVIICPTDNPRIRELTESAGKLGIPVICESRNYFDRTLPKGHQNVAAYMQSPHPKSVKDLCDRSLQEGRVPLFLFLDGIDDPGNFGAVLRVADAAGADGVVIQSHRSAPVTGVVAKASAGAVHHVEIVETVNIKYAIDELKKEGMTVVGADVTSSARYWDADLRGPLAVVVGSEGEGMRRIVRERCDMLVSIPMHGKVTSLNVAAASAVLLYEVIRQRAEKATVNR